MDETKTSDRSDTLKLGVAQIAPVWLDREQTLAKVVDYVEKAAIEGCELVAFGEALVPGYPFWIERTNGAEFNSPLQKDLHAHYMNQAVQFERGDLDPILQTAAAHDIAIVVGTVERAPDRGGHSLYCSLVFIDAQGSIQSVHRKLMPTYEERLTWSTGDGHGLRVHALGAFTVGGLNCWENWMPLVRASLNTQGEDLHVAIWPGNVRNTLDITTFMAKEGRSYVLSASGLMRKSDFPLDTPHLNEILSDGTDVFADGGSCIAGPDGEWVVEPVAEEETLLVATIDHGKVRAERQNFDPAGHYSRPDVTRLILNRDRQSVIEIEEDQRGN